MTNHTFKGVWPALLTPVHSDGQPNESELEKLIELLISQEMDGLYLLGSTGQGFLFSEEERKFITQRTVQIVNGRLPVMVQVGAMNTEESIRLAKHAADNGADGISSVGPIYYAGGSEMAFTHYRRIAEATDLPFFPYQIGGAANRDVILRLLDLPQVKGMKLTTDKLLEIGSISNLSAGKWQLFSGADELMCQAAICGTAGAIGSFYNMFGPTCKYIRSSFLEGHVLEAQDFMLQFQGLIEKILPCIWTFIVRGMELKYGIRIGTPKPPLLAPEMPWTDEEVIAMMDAIDSFGLKEA
ncbi:dihydrodipicolinate synthase family protein [Dyadobacter sp. CY323]|uniref:dihydrodipicolinate synthase family protein n=1 Tax=Dyadobacter sp. CY323 TaxID=2907302 RepID=UPI001F353544|nr:dihydrodipicolinate synthase family protein [Dyadobacter sp. CY323]MCE6988567.1 dihydrodipicolinate synthase family protein [Dyadobacter sp. CY323]